MSSDAPTVRAPANGADRNSGPELAVISSITIADAKTAAALHASQIPEGFLAALGPSFLRRLYQRIASVPDSFLLVAESGGYSIGFIAGSTDVAGLFRTFLVRDGVPAGLGAAIHLVKGWRSGLQTLRHGLSGQSGAGRGAELLAITVDPAWQGQGVGKVLVASFLGELGARGVDDAYVVVAEDNATAVRLYQQAGFAVDDRFELHPGTTSLLLQWHRPPQAAVDPA